MLAYILSPYDFGYTWPWTYGHLIPAVGFAVLAWLLYRRVYRWVTAIFLLLAAWAMAGFLIIQFMFGYNKPVELPAEHFMTSGVGRVLDVGCGSGRATVAIGLARPGVKLAALDNFSAEYIRGNSEDLLKRNLRAAGIDAPIEILRSDMRHIPAADQSFDGVLSTYAIDHIDRQGIEHTLGEISRVLKPGGEFLMMVFRMDPWLRITYGPLMMHQRRLGPNFWEQNFERAGLKVIEKGTRPGTVYFLCRKQ